MSAGVRPSKIRGHQPYFLIFIIIFIITIILIINITKMLQDHTIKTILIIMCEESAISGPLSEDTRPTKRREQGREDKEENHIDRLFLEQRIHPF